MSTKLKPLAEQVIVITGASSGIGLATAREAVRRGAAVVLVARNEPVLEKIATELREADGEVAVCAVDVADEGAARRIAQVAEDEFGGFDTWVNCASVSDYGTLEQIGMAEHRRLFEVNYFAMVEACLVALEHLRARGGGAIVNIGSILSDRTIIEQGPYSAAKHAVRSLTETLRMDIDREGLPISVTLIKPGGIHTPFPEHARNHMDAPPRVPQVIYGPELVADAILFAAEHPRRQIYVGGNGFFQSVVARLFPRTTDRIMEAVMVRAQQSADDPGDPAARDNLFEPKKDGEQEGSQDFHVRRTSLFLEAQKHPLAAAAIIGAGAVGAAALVRRKRSAGARAEAS
jgi:short-subunit dehydrogenase